MKPRRLNRGHFGTYGPRVTRWLCLNEAPAVKPGTHDGVLHVTARSSCLNEAPAVKPGTLDDPIKDAVQADSPQ